MVAPHSCVPILRGGYHFGSRRVGEGSTKHRASSVEPLLLVAVVGPTRVATNDRRSQPYCPCLLGAFYERVFLHIDRKAGQRCPASVISSRRSVFTDQCGSFCSSSAGLASLVVSRTASVVVS